VPGRSHLCLAARGRRRTGIARIANFVLRSFRAARAARVRSDICLRSFSGRAAYRCNMKGSAPAPSSATMNDTRCAIRPAIKATSPKTVESMREFNPAFIAGHLHRLACCDCVGKRFW
jgi:hypothetical protein